VPGTGAGLPAATNRFVGRRSDIDNVAGALRASRLVTITGPGGVGKTRLALEIGRRRATTATGAVVLVDLSPVGETRLVMGAVAEAVGFAGASGDDTDELAQFLAGRSLLLIVDNCEHLQDRVATTVMSLLEGCSRLRVLATSREALRLPGETVWSLGPMAPDEALRLFIERAEAARADATTGADQAIEEICTRLEGLPLALELAAARASSLSLHAILERLGDRLDLLSSRARGAPARHRSLRATIEWSVELLSERERIGFMRLALFPGSFALGAAQEIVQISLDDLDGLVAKSLVATIRAADAGVRYRMLDTVRTFAREGLRESGEQNALRQRHLAFYVRRAEELHEANALGGSDAEVQSLSENLDNLRAAVAWAYEHDPEAGLRLMGAGREAWFSRSQTEGRNWAERLLERHRIPDRARALGLLCSGRLATAHQDHAVARPLLTEAAELAERLDETKILAPALHYRGISGMLSRQLDAAATDLERSIELFRALDQRQGIGRGLGILGFVHLYGGRPLRARGIFEEALREDEQTDDSWGVGQASLGLGLTAKASGENAAAIEHLSRSIVSLVAASDATILGVALSTLAALTFDQDPRRALRLAGTAVAFRERVGGAYPPATVAELESLRERGTELLGAAETDAHWEAGRQLDPAATVELIEGSRPRREAGPLTTRQREIASLVAEGLTNAQIAARLHLSERTVENHVFNALTSLGLHNRVELATWIAEQRVLDLR
jgi:predicted ATPase/DNA-binding CsgD family transcriptional regulator